MTPRCWTVEDRGSPARHRFAVLWALTTFARLLPALAVILMLTHRSRRTAGNEVAERTRDQCVLFRRCAHSLRRRDADKDDPDGSGLLSTTLCAVSGPAFDTVIRYVTCTPFFADAGPTMLTATSAVGGGSA